MEIGNQILMTAEWEKENVSAWARKHRLSQSYRLDAVNHDGSLQITMREGRNYDLPGSPSVPYTYGTCTVQREDVASVLENKAFQSFVE